MSCLTEKFSTKIDFLKGQNTYSYSSVNLTHPLKTNGSANIFCPICFLLTF